MKQSDKIRVAVLYGGRSAEHEVSLQSAANVIQYLDKSRFEIIPIGIDKQGNWLLGYDIFTDSLVHHAVQKLHGDNSTWFTPEWVSKALVKQEVKGLRRGKGTNELAFDVVFPVVHGMTCEDGTLQGLLELANVAYVGSGVLSSAIGMDKDVSKRLAKNAGMNVAPFIVIKQDEWFNFPEKVHEQTAKEMNYPVFVKPVNTGSSVGINKIKSSDHLSRAIDEAFQFDTKVIIEKALNIKELEVAVLESLEPNADPIVSVVGEVRPSHEFYSYEAKYLDENGADLLIPTEIACDLQEQAREMAKQLFLILECEGMARVDLFLNKENQQIYFNEINTLPGFTQISMYPKLMNASGIAYSDLLTHLIELALRRHKKRSKLIRSYSG